MRRVYELPESKDDRITLIKSIPSDWTDIYSNFEASKSMYANGLVDKDASLCIRKSVAPLAITVHTRGDLLPLMRTMLFESKWHSSVCMDLKNCEQRLFESAKALAASLVAAGYGFHELKAACRPYSGIYSVSLGFMEMETKGRTLTVGYDSERGGRDAYISTLLDACKRMKLKPIKT